jgi:energy-coupling factor transporter transmembrane protein EcfT
VSAGTGRLAGANPLALLGAALLVDLALLASIDAVTAGTAVVLELLLLPLARVPARSLLARGGAALSAAALLALTVALYGQEHGRVYLAFGVLVVSDGSLILAGATLLRLLAIALPAVVLLAGLDATRLADALAQQLRLPARFVLAALAAVRLVEVLRDDWRTLALARRARGVGDGRRLRRLPGQVFGLLVVALRRAGTLATTMEARGLGAPGPRTWTRPARFSGVDAVVLAAGLGVALVAVTVGIATGSWRAVLT